MGPKDQKNQQDQTTPQARKELMIWVNVEKCTGCRLCEQVCAVHHTGQTNTIRSRIMVVKWEDEGYYLPLLCQQCEEPACAEVCPRDAITRDEHGAMIVDEHLCIGCKLCVGACPFGAMAFDTHARKVFKCDLCGGEPTCASFCLAGALEVRPLEASSRNKRREAARNYGELLRKHT